MVSDDYISVGFAVALLADSKYHQQYSIEEYLDAHIFPPIQCGQVRFYLNEDDNPFGMVTWAWLSDSILESIHKTGREIEHDEWHCGNNLFCNDFIAPYGDANEIIIDLKKNLFPEHSGSSLQRRMDGSVRKIQKWHGIKYKQQMHN